MPPRLIAALEARFGLSDPMNLSLAVSLVEILVAPVAQLLRPRAHRPTPERAR